MSFTTPLLLLALLVVPAVIAAAIVADRRKAPYPVAFTNLERARLGRRPTRQPRWRRFLPLALLLLALVFAATALARPHARLSEPDQNATIVLLVDVSGSMRANDVEPTRLDAAVAAMRTFLDRLPSQFKVGLVAFSSEPEPLIAPDLGPRRRSSRSIELLEPEAGTAVGDGIEVAVKMLQASLAPGRVRPHARPAGPGRDRPALRRRPEPGRPAAARCRPQRQARRDPHLPGVARHPERHRHVRLRRLHELGSGAARPGDDERDRRARPAARPTPRRPPRASSQIYRTLGSSIGRTHKEVRGHLVVRRRRGRAAARRGRLRAGIRGPDPLASSAPAGAPARSRRTPPPVPRLALGSAEPVGLQERRRHGRRRLLVDLDRLVHREDRGQGQLRRDGVDRAP